MALIRKTQRASGRQYDIAHRRCGTTFHTASVGSCRRGTQSFFRANENTAPTPDSNAKSKPSLTDASRCYRSAQLRFLWKATSAFIRNTVTLADLCGFSPVRAVTATDTPLRWNIRARI
jgi:hypothetical protein